MQNGHGKLTKKNGDIFEGTYKDGQFEGEIIIHYADGAKFRGTYHNGLRNGQAIEVSKEGKRFEGSYKNGKRNGKFVEKDRNGNITAQGVYTDGVRNSN